jgi:hypothetical protein
MRSCKYVCDLFSLFVLITSTNSYRFAEANIPARVEMVFRTEEVAGKNRSDSTEQAATIANELACFFSLTTRDVVSEAAYAFRTAA